MYQGWSFFRACHVVDGIFLPLTAGHQKQVIKGIVILIMFFTVTASESPVPKAATNPGPAL